MNARLGVLVAAGALALGLALWWSPWRDTSPPAGRPVPGVDAAAPMVGAAPTPPDETASNRVVWQCVVTEQNGMLLERPTVRGSVADARGEFVACPLTGIGDHGEVAEHGQFSIAVSRDTVRVMIEVAANNAVRTTFRLEVADVDATAPIPLVVNGLCDLQIRVTDQATQAAIGNARVHIHRRHDEPFTVTVGQDALLRAATDADGRASLRPCAGHYQVRCWAPGFLPDDRTVRLVGPSQLLDVALQSGGTVASGLVIEDDTERPGAGATVDVAASWDRSTGPPDLPVVTDAEGRFAIPFDPRIARAPFPQLVVNPPAERTDLILLRTDAVWGPEPSPNPSCCVCRVLAHASG